MPRLTLKTEVLTMSADFHIFVRECPSKIGIHRFHALASPAVGFPRLYSPLTQLPKLLRPSPIADGQSPQTAGHKREVPKSIMVPKSWCRGSRLIPTVVLPS